METLEFSKVSNSNDCIFFLLGMGLKKFKKI